MAAPAPIPIIYTGKEVAAPDWKTFTRDFNARMDRIHQRKQQQRQFDEVQKERRRREFLESVDVDALNSTNESLKAMEYEMVSGFQDWATDRLKNKEGELSDQDLLEARLLSNRIGQEVQKLEGWSKNQQLDLKAAEKNMHLYDQEKVKEKIVNWNPQKDGGYKSTKLDECYRDVPLDEVRMDMLNNKIKNADSFSNVAEKAGFKISDKTKYNSTFWDVLERQDGTQELIPNYGNQVQFVKGAINDAEDEGLLWDLSYEKQFEELDVETKKEWMESAKGNGINKEDTKYYYDIVNNPDMYLQPQRDRSREEVTQSTSDTKDDRIVINPDQATTTEYNTGKTSNRYIGLGENIQKSEQGNINKPENVSSDEKLGNTIPASKMKNYDIVGLDLDDTKNPKAHLKVEIAERQKTKDGKPVYNWFRYKGTEEEIRKQIYDEETEQKSFLGVKYGDKDTSDAAKTYQEFQQDKNKAEFKVFESKGTLDVLAPLKDNPQIAKQFRGIESVSKTNDDDGNIKVLSGQIDTTQLEKGNKYKVNDQVYVWNGQKLVKE